MAPPPPFRAAPQESSDPLHRPTEEVQGYPEMWLPAEEPLTVVTWNLAKKAGRPTREQVEALRYEEGARVLAFQESRRTILLPLGLGAHFARNFGRHGVITAATAQPHEVVAVASPGRELAVTTTKIALLTTHMLSNHHHLLVANVHAINFDRGGRRFAEQLRDLAARMADHDGPIVFCGDMNTWNGDRLGVVLEIANDLGLSEVVMERGVGRRGHATKVGNRLIGLDGELELDRLFHRGLELVEARWLTAYDASDHVPLCATFRVVPHRA